MLLLKNARAIWLLKLLLKISPLNHLSVLKKYISLIYKKRPLIWTPRKRGLFEIFLRKYFRILQILVTQYYTIYGIKRYQENRVSRNNLKLSDITPVSEKKRFSFRWKQPTCYCTSLFSESFAIIIQKIFSSFIDKFVSPYLCGYRKVFNIQPTPLARKLLKKKIMLSSISELVESFWYHKPWIVNC